MFRYWSDFDRTFAALDELRRQLDSTFYFGPARRAQLGLTGWPAIDVQDTGSALVVTADVPGLQASDLNIQLHDGTLTLEGERKVEAPEGYSVHRRERPAARFARSLTLPAKVDPEKVSAAVADGVLRVTLEKAAEARPRQISIKTA